MRPRFPIEGFMKIETPFYYYEMERLSSTLQMASGEASKRGYSLHYALKANANEKILRLINQFEFGADCVSGNEILKALEVGFPADKIVFAGVGKTNREIEIGLDNNISCFNCESTQEIQIIDQIAKTKGKIARIALRINPNVDAKTHRYITTGIEENKFGINPWEMETVVALLKNCSGIQLDGLHFHIGSQITHLEVFQGLCNRINEIQNWFEENNIVLNHINVGGGLGVNYSDPDRSDTDYKAYFAIFQNHLELRPEQKLHFEPGRVLIAQSGTLISRVLYIKNGVKTRFAILDAGMTELIRPALYQAFHKIENLSSKGPPKTYDVVGPICESSDCFGKAVILPETKRGDLMAIRSVGAYGEVMSSSYNLRTKAGVYYSDEI